MSMYLENLDLSLVTKQSTRDAELKFPCKLYRMLMETESKGLTHIVSWHKDGKCFRIHDQEAFVEEILPQYFKKSKYRSFQRQCNLYGFSRITAVKPFWDSCYFHPTFNRGDEGCCKKITRPLRGNNKKATTKTTAATNIKENQSEFIYPATPISRAVSSNHTEVSTQVQSENPVPTPVFSNNSSSSANTTNIETSATSDSSTNQRANNDSNLNLSKDEEKQTKSLISMNRRTSYQDLCFSILGDDCGGLCDDNGQQLVQNLIDFQ